jgi:hypothetical protein
MTRSPTPSDLRRSTGCDLVPSCGTSALLSAPRTRDTIHPATGPHAPIPSPQARHRHRWHLHRHRPDGRRGNRHRHGQDATTPADPSEGALDGARIALDTAGANWSDIAGFIHGTTLATNALIERRGARVATVTTEGFRDILEIAYERRYSQYDLDIDKPDLIVPARPLLHGSRAYRRDRARARAAGRDRAGPPARGARRQRRRSARDLPVAQLRQPRA